MALVGRNMLAPSPRSLMPFVLESVASNKPFTVCAAVVLPQSNDAPELLASPTLPSWEVIGKSGPEAAAAEDVARVGCPATDVSTPAETSRTGLREDGASWFAEAASEACGYARKSSDFGDANSVGSAIEEELIADETEGGASTVYWASATFRGVPEIA
jgi:hypothetical protein